MYLDGVWYVLTARPHILSRDAVDGLVVSLLQDRLLGPVLGILDPKTDKRIAAVCGVIMLLATIVALLLLFVSYAMGVEDYSQGPITLFWLPWPIGGLLCGIAAVIIKGFGRPEA